ncbi:MAG: trigger factor [Thermoleophilia bacterium]|nr:trigger factor [Thermoleophilia bacterium]
MKTKVEELADSKVRLEVEVPEAAVDHAFDHAARDLAEGMRVPGFRKGKVPYAVVAARVGMEALSEEAVRSHVEGWFWDAALTAGVRPVGGPEVDWQLPPERGKAFTFVATVPVAPPPQLADWRALEVPAGETEVPADVIDAELDRLRESQAELMPVSGRPVAPGDTVVLDLVAVEEDKEPAEHRDYVAELGAGRLAGEIEDALLDMSEGDTKVVEIDLLEEGKGTVTVTLNEIKQKRLPELDDELARAATEFETLAELRADVERRLREQLDAALEARFREAALDALVDASGVDGIEPLVERRTGALLAGLVRSLEQRGVSAEAYLAATGQTPETLEQSARAESERAVKRELVLEAAADRLAVEITDAEIEELIRREAAESDDDADAAVEVLRERGGFEQIRGDLRLKKALDAIAAEVKRIPVELAAAREKLWTPEKEKGGSGMKIWTPGTEEPK